MVGKLLQFLGFFFFYAAGQVSNDSNKFISVLIFFIEVLLVAPSKQKTTRDS